LFPTLAVSADAERGGVLFDTCVGCHGSESYDNVYPTYKVPRLGGQWPEYIVAALQGYKDGSREHPTMQAQAASFSTEDMQDIAAYLAANSELATGEVVGTAPEAAATCVACHGAAGQSLAFTFPHLAGQHQDYMVQALKDYKSGARTNVIMAPNAMNLSEADMQAVSAFYAQQKGLQTYAK
jgi:cytochrome c553